MKMTIFERARNKFTAPLSVLEALSKNKKVPESLVHSAHKDLKYIYSAFDKIEKKFFSKRSVIKGKK